MKCKTTFARAAVFLAACAPIAANHATGQQGKVKSIVDAAIQPIMGKYNIPGMAVGIIVGGKPYVFDYGLASRETRKPVTRSTLFEIGSISKTFTATLASYAQVNGQLSLSEKTSRYLPSLRGSKFGDVSLVSLGTHTPGGFPLQVPDNIKTIAGLMRYLKKWQPAYAPGTYRTYANPSIGMLGLIAAKSMNGDFATLMERRLFPALGIASTYINVPKVRMADYAQGYTKKGRPIRMAAAVLSAEA